MCISSIIMYVMLYVCKRQAVIKKEGGYLCIHILLSSVNNISYAICLYLPLIKSLSISSDAALRSSILLIQFNKVW